MLKKLTIALLLISPCFVLAESALFTPVATVLKAKAFEFKDFYSPGDKANEFASGSLGLGDGFELGYSAPRFNDKAYISTWGLEYNLIAPFTDVSPGLAFGISDATNQTSAGRRIYAVATYEIGLNYDLRQSLSAEFSLGYIAGKRSSPFLNSKIPLGGSVTYIVEYDGDNINTGFDFLVYKGITLRAAMRGTTTLLGVKLHYQF